MGTARWRASSWRAPGCVPCARGQGQAAGPRPSQPSAPAAPCLVSKVPSANESSCHGAQEMGLSPSSKAPATRSRRGGESFLSSPARSLTGLSSLPRRGFEGLQGPPTCAAGAGSGVCSGTGREERTGSSTGGSSALREMSRGARMVTGRAGVTGGPERGGTRHVSWWL